MSFPFHNTSAAITKSPLPQQQQPYNFSDSNYNNRKHGQSQLNSVMSFQPKNMTNVIGSVFLANKKSAYLIKEICGFLSIPLD
jgi:hypothetical protein